MIAGRDPNGAGGLVPKLAQGFQLGLDLLEAVAHGCEQAFARLGRGDAACRAREQPKAESRLQPSNGVTQR